jgi:phage terminase small subunit
LTQVSPKNDNLTSKQESFAKAYVELGSGSEAYRQAYDAAKMKSETIHETSSRLLKNPKVAARIKQLQEVHAIRHNITIDSLTEQLFESYEGARKLGQYSAAVAATMSIAKLHGFLRDKVDVKCELTLEQIVMGSYKLAKNNDSAQKSIDVTPDAG